MEKLKLFLQSKKEKSSNQIPKYGMRKLSVGLVSCFLGCAVFMTPSIVNAESEMPAENKAIVADSKESIEAPAIESEDPVSETKTLSADSEELDKPEITLDSVASEIPENNSETVNKNLEKVDETIDLKENENKKFELNDQTLDNKEAKETTELEENKDEIILSDEFETEALKAGEETQAKDISNDIINPRISIRTQNTETPGTLNAANGEQLKWGLSFTTPEGTKEGDTFTIHLSDNMSLKGIEPDTDYALPIEVDGKEIATGKRIDRQTIQYTFTKEINDMRNARVYIINSAQENREKVQNNSEQTFKINVGDNASDEEKIKVDFGNNYHSETSQNLNGKSQYTKFDPKDGSFTQVFYLNPESKEITISTTNDENGREYGKVGFLLSSPHNAESPRSIDFKGDGNTKIEVKKLPKGAKLPDAVIENPDGAQPATNVKGEFRDFKGEPMFTMNFGNGNKIDSPYVVVVKGHANKINGDYPILYSNGTLYGDGTASLFLDNLYSVQNNDTDATGEKVGYFIEHHIYKTKVDGVIKDDETFTVHGSKVSGTKNEYYATNKNVLPGYKFVEVDTNKLVNNPAYDKQGELTQGHFEVNKIKEVTYIYERDIKHGSFQEHHIYQSLDEDGNVVAEETVTKEGKETTGFDKTTYETSKKDQAGNVVTAEKDSDGYKLVKVEASGDSEKKSKVKFNSKGAKTTGNYVNGEKLEVTYTYQKQVVTKGSFKEHHIYQTVDEDGKVISADDKLKKDSESTGKETEEFKTQKIDEDGYTLVKVEGTEGTNFNQEGTAQKTNYKKGETQEVTYTYQKKVITKGKFQEHHIYQTVDEDGNVISTDDKLKKDSESTGKETEEFTTSKKDEEGYTLVKVEGTEGTNFKQDGSAQKTNYKKDETQEVTYTYQKKITTKGTFKEHHIYQTVDEDGNVISTDDKLKKDSESTGKETEEFTTSKKDEEGYTLVKVEGTEGTNFKQDGSAQKTNYKKDETQEVTYTYQKKVTTKGTFKEHHIYQTVDEDGNVISTDDKLKKDSESTGKETEEFTTSKKDEEGYTLVKVEGTEGTNFKQDGSAQKTNYKKGETQEVTYTYQKKVITKGYFQEHHIYRTIDKDGKVTEEIDHGKVKGGTKDMTYTTGKVDKKGFTFIETTNPKENPTFNENGDSATGKFKPGVKQEITYVYEKIVNDPKPEPVKPDTPVDPEKPSTPVDPEKPSTPVDPEKPSTPVDPEKPSTPVDPEKPETKEVVDPKTVEVEKVEETQIEETQISEENVSKKSSTPDYKAPQTFDPGLAPYLGLGSMASTMLAYMEYKRRKRK